MKLLILGRGKTGSLVAEVARERGHDVHILGAADNGDGAGLTAEKLVAMDVVIDFTTPHAVMKNIEVCAGLGKFMVVGTTGWDDEVPSVKKLVEKSGIGFLYGGNFSIGVNLFFEVARTASAALEHEYTGQIFERHHVHKKDAPSGTAITLRNVVKDACGKELEVISFREGDVVGMHEMVLDSHADTIYLCHDAKSRQGFATGAVRGAEWIAGKKGFFHFKEVWRQL